MFLSANVQTRISSNQFDRKIISRIKRFTFSISFLKALNEFPFLTNFTRKKFALKTERELIRKITEANRLNTRYS